MPAAIIARRRYGRLAVLSIVFAITLARAERWEPQPWPAPAPGVSVTEAPPLPRGLFEALYRAYRKSSADDLAGTCPYFPTCSGYGILAVREHGPALGVLLTVDRLLREYPGMDAFDHYPIVTPHGHPRLFDPVPERRD